jgi:hypothetical protein
MEENTVTALQLPALYVHSSCLKVMKRNTLQAAFTKKWKLHCMATAIGCTGNEEPNLDQTVLKLIIQTPDKTILIRIGNRISNQTSRFRGFSGALVFRMWQGVGNLKIVPSLIKNLAQEIRMATEKVLKYYLQIIHTSHKTIQIGTGNHILNRNDGFSRIGISRFGRCPSFPNSARS